MTDNLADDAALAASLVRSAGALARSMRRSGVTTSRKTNVADIVTEADHAAEELIRTGLLEARPEDGIVGEEGTSIEGSSGRTWFIDPVDGTYNYAAGIDFYCSTVALRRQDDVLLGAIHHPESDEVYVGGPSYPGEVDGHRLKPLDDRPLELSGLLTYLHPTYLGTPVADAFHRVMAGCATYRTLGAGSRHATAIAAGQFQLNVQHSVPPWDWLPGAALVRSVGGVAVQVEAAGVTWSLTGVPTAVEEAVARLEQL